MSARSRSTDQSALPSATFWQSSRTAILYFFIGIRHAVIDSALRIPRQRLGLANRQVVCQGLTLAFAPRSIAKRRSADGNLSFIVLIRLSGSLAFLSSSSKANK